MVDNRSAESRSALMSRIRGQNTAPELTVRHLLHSMGYRYRLYRKSLPGTPDIVFPSRKKVIFVHGCFWHAHGCRIGRLPKSHPEFWEAKLTRNQARDVESLAQLEQAGWNALTVWQCQTKNTEELKNMLLAFLGPPGGIPIDNSRVTR